MRRVKGMVGRSGPLLFMIPPKAAFGKNVFQHKNKFAHICLRDRLLPFPMRKILPETVFFAFWHIAAACGTV